MEYKHDSRKNCASPMKRTHNFFSAAHSAMPLLTVPCNLSPVTCIHTFSAKEKDSETGLSYFGSMYYSSDLSIWLSVDPMSDKYPSLSPYAYCANNPIKLMDPNGEEVYIRGDDVSAALEQLQNQTSLKLSIGKDGKLDYEGTANSNIDALIIQAIDDKNITVNIETSKGQAFGDGNVIKNGGGYGGNTYSEGKVSTKQFVCPSILASRDNDVHDSKTGLTMVHELAESFMKTIFLIPLILIPLTVIGQNEKTLCKSCIHKVFYWDNGFKCDEEKLRTYYEYQMNSNITHVNLCERYKEVFRYDNFLCKNLVPLNEFIYGIFKINSITLKDGFYLDENKNFIPQKFYFVSFSCEDSTCPLTYGGCLIVYDLDKFKGNILDKKTVEDFDISIENLKNSDYSYLNTFNISFTMNIQAYFDKDIWALKEDDGTIKALLGDSPLIDLV